MCRFLIAFLALFGTSSGGCPFGAVEGRWTYDCYVFKSVPHTFKDASKVCANFGGLLTSLDSAMESMLVNSFTGHYSGKPAQFDDEWRVRFRRRLNAQVVPPNDLPKPVVPKPPTSSLQCQQGWTYVASSNKCYKAYDGPALWRSWFGAAYRCRSHGGDLAMAKDNATNDAIDQVLQGNATGLFAIGLYSPIPCAPDDNACKWQWADGTPAAYTDWDPEDSYGRPRNVVGPDCVRKFAYVEGGKWDAGSCQEVRPFVCEMPTYAGLS